RPDARRSSPFFHSSGPELTRSNHRSAICFLFRAYVEPPEATCVQRSASAGRLRLPPARHFEWSRPIISCPSLPVKGRPAQGEISSNSASSTQSRLGPTRRQQLQPTAFPVPTPSSRVEQADYFLPFTSCARSAC